MGLIGRRVPRSHGFPRCFSRASGPVALQLAGIGCLSWRELVALADVMLGILWTTLTGDEQMTLRANRIRERLRALYEGAIASQPSLDKEGQMLSSTTQPPYQGTPNPKKFVRLPSLR